MHVTAMKGWQLTCPNMLIRVGWTLRDRLHRGKEVLPGTNQYYEQQEPNILHCGGRLTWWQV